MGAEGSLGKKGVSSWVGKEVGLSAADVLCLVWLWNWRHCVRGRRREERGRIREERRRDAIFGASGDCGGLQTKETEKREGRGEKGVSNVFIPPQARARAQNDVGGVEKVGPPNG